MRFLKPFLISFFLVGIVSFAGQTLAQIRYVVKNTDECPSGTSIFCYTSLTTAITEAEPGDSIEIRPGTYTGNFILNRNISLYGTETARTFLDGGGAGNILSIDGVSALSIRKLTFMRAGSDSSGILVGNSSGVKINNNVFQAGESSTAIQTNNSPTTEIINNTFYKDLRGILSDTTSLIIINNIFNQNSNGTAISPANMDLTNIRNNLFFGGIVGPTIVTDSGDPAYRGNLTDEDPLFVKSDPADVTQRDFHLRTGSPAIDQGDPSIGNDSIDSSPPDIGAYGGPNSDTVPFPVSGLVVTDVTGTSPATVSISWDPNASYRTGGYNVYTRTTSSDYGSPVDVGLVTNYTLTNSIIVSQPTGTPVLSRGIANERLLLYWDTSNVQSATGYEVRYGTTSPPAAVVDAGNTTAYVLSGLTNGTTYYVQVIPYAQATLSIAVTAYYNANKGFESDFSHEVNPLVGDKLYGITASNQIEGYPELLTGHPAVPDSGCFVATAAYGYYSAPQVQALRRFRDTYLMTNAPGKIFVFWYYRYGPIGAEFLNDHPWLKPLARAALLPAVGMSLFMINTDLPIKLAVMLLTGILFAYLIIRKKGIRYGGGH